ncbi:hypothetical protein N9X28_00300 [Candidatus Poseidoniales archaeon]|nr:hypothetical protein [Candidatus Poseidoniales archaeon]
MKILARDMSKEAGRTSRKNTILKRLGNMNPEYMFNWAWVKEPELWTSWFELNWEYYSLDETVSESDFKTLNKSVLAVPRSIYDLKMGLVGVEWENPNLKGEFINLDFPLRLYFHSEKGIWREVSLRIDGGLGVINGIRRHQKEFGTAEINLLKQDLYDNLDLGVWSHSYNSDEQVWLRENDEQAAIIHMENHKKYIDAFFDHMLGNGSIIEKNGEYIITNE